MEAARPPSGQKRLVTDSNGCALAAGVRSAARNGATSGGVTNHTYVTAHGTLEVVIANLYQVRVGGRRRVGVGNTNGVGRVRAGQVEADGVHTQGHW